MTSRRKRTLAAIAITIAGAFALAQLAPANMAGLEALGWLALCGLVVLVAAVVARGRGTSRVSADDQVAVAGSDQVAIRQGGGPERAASVDEPTLPPVVDRLPIVLGVDSPEWTEADAFAKIRVQLAMDERSWERLSGAAKSRAEDDLAELVTSDLAVGIGEALVRDLQGKGVPATRESVSVAPESHILDELGEWISEWIGHESGARVRVHVVHGPEGIHAEQVVLGVASKQDAARLAAWLEKRGAPERSEREGTGEPERSRTD